MGSLGSRGSLRKDGGKRRGFSAREGLLVS